MNCILLDIGNSVIKVAAYKDDSTQQYNVRKIKYEKYNFSECLYEILNPFRDFNSDFVGISLVDSRLKDITVSIISKYFNSRILSVGFKHHCDLVFNYENTLGSDRIASAIGAYYDYNDFKNILIVDFGTATTYNLLQDNVYSGGIITPGIYLSYKALIENTDLPYSDLELNYKTINNNTKSSINSGIILNAINSFEGITSNFQSEFNNLKIICTGGGSSLMNKLSDKAKIIDEDLVLKGILKIIKYYY